MAPIKIFGNRKTIELIESFGFEVVKPKPKKRFAEWQTFKDRVHNCTDNKVTISDVRRWLKETSP